LAAALAAKEVQLTRVIRAGDQVQLPIAIEIHKLWTGADASVNGNHGVDPAGFQVDRPGVTRFLVGAEVTVDPKLAAEIAAAEILAAAAVQVHDPGTRMPPGTTGVNDAVRVRQTDRRVKHAVFDPHGHVSRRIV